MDENKGNEFGTENQQNYGQALKNNYGMKLTFSILEILCCCGCNIVTMIMGILGCVFTSQANSAYKEGRWAMTTQTILMIRRRIPSL